MKILLVVLLIVLLVFLGWCGVGSDCPRFEVQELQHLDLGSLTASDKESEEFLAGLARYKQSASQFSGGLFNLEVRYAEVEQRGCVVNFSARLGGAFEARARSSAGVWLVDVRRQGELDPNKWFQGLRAKFPDDRGGDFFAAIKSNHSAIVVDGAEALVKRKGDVAARAEAMTFMGMLMPFSSRMVRVDGDEASSDPEWRKVTFSIERWSVKLTYQSGRWRLDNARPIN